MTSDPTSPPTVDVRGTTVAYRREGTGTPLVVLTGLGLSGRRLALHDLLAAHHDVIALDLPGFGDSPAAPSLGGFDDLAILLAETLDLLGTGPVHLVGHSFGGWVAAEFAAFYPERLRTLTLIAPLGLRVPGQAPVDLFRRSADDRRALLVDDPASLDAPGADPLEHLLQDYAELTALGQFAWNPRYDVRLDHRLGRVHVPTLVLGSEHDRVLPAAHLRRYAELLPEARLSILTDTTAHGLIAQEPVATADAVLDLTGGN